MKRTNKDYNSKVSLTWNLDSRIFRISKQIEKVNTVAKMGLFHQWKLMLFS